MIAEGHSNKTIGYELGISVWTVSTHLRRIFAKLGVRSRAAMVGRLAEAAVDTRQARSSERTQLNLSVVQGQDEYATSRSEFKAAEG